MLRLSFSDVPLYWLLVLGALSLSSAPARGHVILDEPNGGEVLEPGSVFTIEWHIQIVHTLLNWDLWYSTTGAAGPWITIATNLPAGSQSVDSIHTYEWTVPDDLSNQVRVRVRMDNDGMDYEDISNANFTIGTAPVPVINEIHTDPDPTIAGDANGDGVSDGLEDQFVELVNNTGSDMDFSKWTLSDDFSIRHTFPSGTIVPGGGAIVVFGGGTPIGSFGGALVQTASTGGLSLNSGGDTVTLDDAGALTVATKTFGIEANNNQSLTRDPDITGAFVQHSSATGSGGARFSAGTQIDGTVFSSICSPSTPISALPDVGFGIANRFLSIEAGDPGRSQAIRVIFTHLDPPPYELWHGTEMWVQAPSTKCEHAGVSNPPCPPVPGPDEFQAATLGCTPHFMDWNTAGTIHVYHEGIIPDSLYSVEVIDEGCDTSDSASYSPPLFVETSKYGDVGTFFSGVDWPPPDGGVDIVADTIAVLSKFSGNPTAPISSRADLEPRDIDWKITISDVLRTVKAFAGDSYPFVPSVGDPCP